MSQATDRRATSLRTYVISNRVDAAATRASRTSSVLA